jgi:hypothetical protein
MAGCRVVGLGQHPSPVAWWPGGGIEHDRPDHASPITMSTVLTMVGMSAPAWLPAPSPAATPGAMPSHICAADPLVWSLLTAVWGWRVIGHRSAG